MKDLKTEKTKIEIGDKFYHNNYSTKYGQSLPDYLIVIDKNKGFVTAKYENHFVYTNERLFDETNLFADSNLNPGNKNPEWVFIAKNA